MNFEHRNVVPQAPVATTRRAKAKKAKKVVRALKAAARPASKKNNKMNVERRRRRTLVNNIRKEAAALGALPGMGRGARGQAAAAAAAVEAAEESAAAARRAEDDAIFEAAIRALPEAELAEQANRNYMARRAANAEQRAAMNNMVRRFGAMDIGTLHGPRNNNGLTPWNRHRSRQAIEGTGMRIVRPGSWGSEEGGARKARKTRKTRKTRRKSRSRSRRSRR